MSGCSKTLARKNRRAGRIDNTLSEEARSATQQTCPRLTGLSFIQQPSVVAGDERSELVLFVHYFENDFLLYVVLYLPLD
ncbi:MAG: hypothetical protein ABFD62_14110, partial [Syntrophaceae bacterium]